jgi:hypothetical protein
VAGGLRWLGWLGRWIDFPDLHSAEIGGTRILRLPSARDPLASCPILRRDTEVEAFCVGEVGWESRI